MANQTHAHIEVDNGVMQYVVPVPGTDPIESTTVDFQDTDGFMGQKGCIPVCVTDASDVIINDAEVELVIQGGVGIVGVTVTPPTIDDYKVYLLLIG